MKGTVTLAGGVLLLAIVAGCGQVGGQPATATGCAAYAVRAVHRHVTISALPVPCRGLRSAALGQAVAIAVSELSLPGDKSLRRHRAGIARAHLAYLISAADRAAAVARRARARRGRSAAGPVTASGTEIPPDIAALATWLLTACSGIVMLRRVLGGTLFRRRGSIVPVQSARPGGVIVAHAGLAAAGLAGWTGYLISGWTAFAWGSLAVLLPVVGLGISTLLLGIPDSGSASRSRAPVLVIAAHGALATLTVLLVLLGVVHAVTAAG